MWSKDSLYGQDQSKTVDVPKQTEARMIVRWFREELVKCIMNYKSAMF